MCGDPVMASSSNPKTLNAEAQPWFPLSHLVCRKPLPIVQLPLPLPPPFMHHTVHTEVFMPYIGTPSYGFSCYNTQLQPQAEQASDLWVSYRASAVGGSVPSGSDGGEIERKVVAPERSRVGLRAEQPPRLRRGAMWRRGKSVCRKGLGSVWMPKNKSDEDASGLWSSRPPPPPTKVQDGCNSTELTTVMIRNIPNQYRRDMFLRFLDVLCLQHNQLAAAAAGESYFEPPRLAYDFVYLPMDFRRGDNLGYAFVNVTTAKAARKVEEILQNYRWGTFEDSTGEIRESRKICAVNWARIQGMDQLTKRFRNSNFFCHDEGYLPATFSPPRDGTEPVSQPTNVGRCLGSRSL
ncbi:protein terminal ear1-like [Diospyros lotus]|uniref:protein terminal ear1-like n=1 Tax=Diospyros lotus TaxID=55363 RepID=UPI0022533933|nr:protein terminal ear1-like [Diospyros lotus]